MTDRNGQPWSEAEERELAAMVRSRMLVNEIAEQLGRTPIGVAGKMQELRRRGAGHVSRYAVRRYGPVPIA
jgi:hypothetical protein